MNYHTSLGQTSVGRSVAMGMGVSLEAQRARMWDDVARLLIFLLFILAALTFPDYGITHDEEVQHLYGKKLLSFYTSGFEDRSAFQYKDLYLYGGLFDLVVAVLVPFSPLEEYETRHLLCALVGVLGIAGCWRYGRLLAGPRAGFLSALLLSVCGVYYGAMFNNTKDVPFAAGMVWSLYFATRILLQAPRPSRSAVLKFGLTLGLSMAIRVGALLVAIYLGLALMVMWAVIWRREGLSWAARDARRMIMALLPAVPIAYLLMAVFWPWAVLNPLNPILALLEFSHFPIRIGTLFEGHEVLSSDPPPSYLPVYLAVKLPEVVLVGLLGALAMASAWVARRHERPGWAMRAVPFVPLILAVFLPILVFVALRPTVYNGVRHFLFVVPPLVVMAAMAFDRGWRLASRWRERAGKVFAAVLWAVVMLHVWKLGQLHPNQYVYYNHLVGGVKGAAGSWEMDYWGNSLHEATKELVALLELENNGVPPAHPYTVGVCGNALAVRYELPPWLKMLNGVVSKAEFRKADFFIYYTQDKTCGSNLDGRPIIEIIADDVPLSIVKDRRPSPGGTYRGPAND